MLNLFRSRRANEDILDIVDYLASEGPDVAMQFYDGLKRTENMLCTHPEAGALRTFEDTRLGNMRMFPVSGFSNYLLFYVVAGTRLTVVRVLHGARDVPNAFGEI